MNFRSLVFPFSLSLGAAPSFEGCSKLLCFFVFVPSVLFVHAKPTEENKKRKKKSNKKVGLFPLFSHQHNVLYPIVRVVSLNLFN